MVPTTFHDFFLAEAGASGALVGLLFVAISVAPERISGKTALIVEQARASSALTALVAPLTLALVGLLPGGELGLPAIVVSVAALLFVAATLRRYLSVPKEQRENPRGLAGLIAFTGVMGVILGYGIDAIINPKSTSPVEAIAAATIGSLLLGVDRAWALIGGRGRGRGTSLMDLIKGDDQVS
jgi:hypothetical protein